MDRHPNKNLHFQRNGTFPDQHSSSDLQLISKAITGNPTTMQFISEDKDGARNKIQAVLLQ
jgi:hypothetical protein